MQIIFSSKSDVATYCTEQLQHTVPAPLLCPGCEKAGGLEAHGFYERWVSGAGGLPVRIAVRRFFVGGAK